MLILTQLFWSNKIKDENKTEWKNIVSRKIGLNKYRKSKLYDWIILLDLNNR